MERYLVRAIAALSGFAEVEEIEWVTYSAGDDAAVLRPEHSVDVMQLREPFRTLDDVIEVSVLLWPVCVSTDGVEFVVPQGATSRSRSTHLATPAKMSTRRSF